jgi:predicted KAP-like P-loop ATPase
MTGTNCGMPFLNDHETNCDLLNYSAIAETIVKTLEGNRGKAITIGVHGDWGAGKSSILEMISMTFKDKDKVLCLKFNGWSFQGFEDAKITLLEGIVTGIIEARSLWQTARVDIAKVFQSIDLLKLAKKAGGLAIAHYTGFAGVGLLEIIKSKISDFTAKPEDYLTKENLLAAAGEMNDLMKAPEEKKRVAQEVVEFHKSFSKLLETAGIEQLVVLVDDLDRCLPEIAIETLEAIRLFVTAKKTAFVIGADEEMIENAVKKHFKDFPDAAAGKAWAKNYLEKLIHIPFRIPNLGEMETKMYVSLLLIGAAIGESEPVFQNLVTIAKDRIKKPWEAKLLDQDTVNTALEGAATKAKEALLMSEQIGPLLARGTNGNPRQIKRFLNTLGLRKAIADARGFGNEIKLQILAKLMLSERLFKHIFDRIANAASTDAHGCCENIAWLEKAANGKDEEDSSKEAGKGERKAENLEKSAIDEWLKEANVLTWARMSPSLAGLDLRPYLFISQEKNAFSATLSLPVKLLTLVEQLRGPRIMVSAKTEEVGKLDQAEAEQVFDAIRSQIIQEDSFLDKPIGIDGMILLAQKKQFLQLRLLSFLENLPEQRLGAWVAVGWQDAFTESVVKQRFLALQTKWGQVDRLKPFMEAGKKVNRGGK